jgi:hypothetical protein
MFWSLLCTGCERWRCDPRQDHSRRALQPRQAHLPRRQQRTQRLPQQLHKEHCGEPTNGSFRLECRQLRSDLTRKRLPTSAWVIFQIAFDNCTDNVSKRLSSDKSSAHPCQVFRGNTRQNFARGMLRASAFQPLLSFSWFNTVCNSLTRHCPSDNLALVAHA